MTYDYLVLHPNAEVPLYQQLYESLRNSIERGHLTRNEKLPSIRKLSEDLHLSRTTIEMAYQQLCGSQSSSVRTRAPPRASRAFPPSGNTGVPYSLQFWQ